MQENSLVEYEAHEIHDEARRKIEVVRFTNNRIFFIAIHVPTAGLLFSWICTGPAFIKQTKARHPYIQPHPQKYILDKME